MLTIKRLTAVLLLTSTLSYGQEQPTMQSFQSHPNQWSMFADVLVWGAQETCSDWAFVVAPPLASPPAATQIAGRNDAVLKAVDFDWNVGVRTGISYAIERDRWDTRLYYTWYHTSASSHLHPQPGKVIQSQFIATDFLLTLPGFSTSFNGADVTWNILFNMFNWDLGRIFYLGQSLSLRPYLGLEGGWIHQTVSSHWFHSNTLVSYNAREKLKHHFWGIGPDVGVNSKWNCWKNLQHALSIFGDFGMAFMWGHWSVDEVAHTTIDVTTINTQPDRTMGSLTLQSAAGFEWNARFRNNRSLFTFKVGYEFQLWAQQLQFFQHFSGILNNALILQGVTGRFQVDF